MFAQGAYSKWATTLVEKGYKVARIEQTETPLQLEERNKERKSGPKDKVHLHHLFHHRLLLPGGGQGGLSALH